MPVPFSDTIIDGECSTPAAGASLPPTYLQRLPSGQLALQQHGQLLHNQSLESNIGQSLHPSLPEGVQGECFQQNTTSTLLFCCCALLGIIMAPCNDCFSTTYVACRTFYIIICSQWGVYGRYKVSQRCQS